MTILMNRNIPNVADELLENFRTKFDDKKLSKLAGQTLAANQKSAIEYASICNN